MNRRVLLRIEGLVQGVYFRASAQDEARRLALQGWVCNRFDGAVEVVAEGAPEVVDAFVAWCHHGPSQARVERVLVSEQEPEGLSGGFHVRRSE